MHRLVLATLALALGSVALAAPAQAATYSLTLTASHTNRDVGQTLTLTGKVTGSKAAKKKLTVQRRAGAGAWTTIGTVRTTSKKTYSFKHRVTRTGAQSFRVVAPKNGSTKIGVSPTRNITGWTWLDLYDESYYSAGGVQRGWVGPVNGGTPPRETLGLYSSDGSDVHGSVAWRTESLCDRLTAAFGMSDSDGTAKWVRISLPGADVEVQPSEITTLNRSLVDVGLFSMRRFTDSGEGYVAIESPRAHCKVARLPVAYD